MAPLTLISAAQQPVYAVAGGNHVTIEVVRAPGTDVVAAASSNDRVN